MRDSDGALRGMLREGPWLVFPFVAIVLCYAPVWLTEYGFGEDYRLLAFYARGATNRTLMIAEGRPLQALWTNLVFGHLSGIGSLAMLRFANVVLLGLCAVAFARLWRSSGSSRSDAALAGTLMLTLPAQQVFAATAAYGIVPLGAVLATMAALCTRAGFESGERRAGAAWRAAALLLLVLAVTGYQPAAMLYWVAAAILLILPAEGSRQFRRKLVTFGVTGVFAIAIGFAIYRIGRAAFPMELEGLDRAGLANDPVLKFLWFLLYPLVHALNPWRLHLDRPLALGVGFVVLGGLWMHLRRASGRGFLFLVALALVPSSYLPNLVVAENWSSFRSQIALSAIVVVYLIVALHVLEGRVGSRVRTVVLAGLTGFGMASASLNVTRLFVRPQREELAIVRATLGGLPAGYTRMGVVMSTENETLAPFSLYDEFGRPSTSFTWGVTDLPYLVLREQRPMAENADLEIRDVRAAGPPVDTILDWGRILRRARSGTTAR